MSEETEGTQPVSEETNALTATAAEASPAVEETKPDETKEPEKKREPDERDRALRRLAFEKREAERQARELKERLSKFEQNAEPDLEARIKQEAAKLRDQEKRQEKLEAWDQKGRSEFPDFVERCNAIAELGVAPEFVDIVTDLDDGHKVVAHLADNPAEALEIARLPAHRQAVALAKLARSLAEKPAAEAAKAPPPVSKAPPPIKPVRGEAKVEIDPDKMSPEEFRKWRAETARRR